MARFGGFEVGYVFHDTYRIVRRLGMGGMGVVFEVEHLRLPRRLALKVMTAPVTASSEYNMRFRQEAEIAASINHSNLVSVFDWNVTPDERLPYLVMELLSGEDLAQVLKRSGALPRSVAISILAQAVAALEVVHSHGIVHRDIKPANLFLCKNSIIPHFTKLLDFGIAKSTQPSPGLVTNNLVLMGTPAYMAPEQARGDLGPVGPRADQFALGVVFYEMVSGRPAFHRTGEAPMSTLFRVLSEEPPALEDAALDAAVRRSLRKRPDERYPSLSAMLSAIVEASAVPVDEIAVPERTEKVVLRSVEIEVPPQAISDALAPTHPPSKEALPEPPNRGASVLRPIPMERKSTLMPLAAVAAAPPLSSVMIDGWAGGDRAAGALVSMAPTGSALASASARAEPPPVARPSSDTAGRTEPLAGPHLSGVSFRRGWLMLGLLFSAALAPLVLTALVIKPPSPGPELRRQRPFDVLPDLSASWPLPDLAATVDAGASDASLCLAATAATDPRSPVACSPPLPSIPSVRPAPRPRRPTIYVVNRSVRNDAVTHILECVRGLSDGDQWRLLSHPMQLVVGSERRLVIYDDYWLSRPVRHDLEYCLGTRDVDVFNIKNPIYVRGEEPKPWPPPNTPER